MAAHQDLSQLLEMGFEEKRATMALKKAGSLHPALQWLEDNGDKEISELEAEETDETTEAPALEAGETAKSMKCLDCNRKFRSMNQVQFHADKSGHENFEESTEELAPLTAEEKATKLAEMRAAAAEKKAKQAIIDKEEARANDKIRAKSQKDLESIKDDMEKKERVKEAAAKKQDKVNEAAAKKRALAKIQADKDARRLKAEKEKAEREGRAPPAEVAAPIAAPAAARATPTQARLRLQTAAGTLTKTYPVETTLFELAHALAIEVGGEVTSFTMTYPKKTFDSVDFGLTLQEAGLVPSAVLIVK